MNSKDKEAIFIAAAKADLDESLRRLDHAISKRLRVARQYALDTALGGKPAKKPLPWLLPVAGMAAASVAALALFFLLQPQKQEALVSQNSPQNLAESVSGGMEDLELLASSEAIEFYDDLEFYGWLAEENRAG